MKAHSLCGGDLVRALATLTPADDAAREGIARLLGFELRDPQASPRMEQPQVAGSAKQKVKKEKRGEAVHVIPNPAMFLRDRKVRMRQEKEKASTAPAYFIAPQPINPLPASAPEDTLPRPPFEPLIKPQWSRAVISTAARIRTPNGPPDLEMLVTAAAQRRPMDRLALSLSETASGADVLVDIGESMTLFTRDQDDLVHLMRRVLGAGLVSVFRFSYSPVNGVYRPLRLKPEPYRPPRPGWPVILLTDLGIGAGIGAAPSEHWRTFSDVVRAAGCHAVALVPYPPERWPREIAAALDLIQWDRRTSVRTIRAALGRSHGSAR